MLLLASVIWVFCYTYCPFREALTTLGYNRWSCYLWLRELTFTEVMVREWIERTVTLALDAGAINRLISNINLYLLLFHFFRNDVSLRYVTKWRENSHIVTEHLLFVASHCWQLQSRRVHCLLASV